MLLRPGHPVPGPGMTYDGARGEVVLFNESRSCI
jgi:hypothetical protein